MFSQKVSSAHTSPKPRDSRPLRYTIDPPTTHRPFGVLLENTKGWVSDWDRPGTPTGSVLSWELEWVSRSRVESPNGG